MRRATAITTVSIEVLAEQNPTISFVHAFLGIVKTNFHKQQELSLEVARYWTLLPTRPWNVGIDETSTSGVYPPRGE